LPEQRGAPQDKPRTKFHQNLFARSNNSFVLPQSLKKKGEDPYTKIPGCNNAARL
jgi:hypothetical protein